MMDSGFQNSTLVAEPTQSGRNAEAPTGGETVQCLRILAVADLWQGSDGYAYVRAFRRLGHSVRAITADNFFGGGWTNRSLRILRHVIDRVLVREYNRALEAEARVLRPHVLFVFKGRHVLASTIASIRAGGVTALNVYPDVSFLAHGPHIPRALLAYDWIFQTKTFGVRDLDRLLGVKHSSFLPPCFDPEVHRPVALNSDERAIYECDVSFVGTWSPKKERVLADLGRALPDVSLRIWGEQWGNAGSGLRRYIQGRGVFGIEFAKAMVGSRINLGLLSEARKGSSAGDQITARTFHILGTGSFMLHERTSELLTLFREGRECACFENIAELVDRIRYYLEHEEERRAIAEAGQRAAVAQHTVDHRAGAVLAKVNVLRQRHVISSSRPD